ncbi:hypothetical protein B9Z55_026748 [Caenorhabditis nigoni]|nr:hypothetical protein B9Z55_026748 [Caenorhabditis nigoni]
MDMFVKAFNGARSDFAKNAHIANMNQVEYDSDLEKEIYAQLAITGGCPMTDVVEKDPLVFYMNFKMDNSEESRLVSDADRTHMAFVTTNCLDYGKEMHHFVFKKTNAAKIHGPPGSKCSSGRKANSDGLCALGKSYGRKIVERYRIPIREEDYEQDPLTGKMRKKESWLDKIFYK